MKNCTWLSNHHVQRSAEFYSTLLKTDSLGNAVPEFWFGLVAMTYEPLYHAPQTS